MVKETDIYYREGEKGGLVKETDIYYREGGEKGGW